MNNVSKGKFRQSIQSSFSIFIIIANFIFYPDMNSKFCREQIKKVTVILFFVLFNQVPMKIAKCLKKNIIKSLYIQKSQLLDRNSR